MSKEISKRIKELVVEEQVLRGKNNTLLQEGQKLQEAITQNNTRLIQILGAMIELKKVNK